MRRPIVFLFLAVVALVAAACGNVELPFEPSTAALPTLDALLTSASVDPTTGVKRGGFVPDASGGPAFTVTGNTTIVNGGATVATLSSASPFQTIYVTAGARTLGLNGGASGGITGYYEIALPAATTSAPVLLTFPQTLPLTEFDLLFSVVDPSGRVSTPSSLTTSVTIVGTGDVQVTLSWDSDADVDLHVIEPGGRDVYYGAPDSPNGGTLDLDSNAACSFDNVRNENITWPIGKAPRGTYTVRVDYWSNCGVTRTNYTVRVNNGGSVQVFTGFFTGNGDQGSAGDGRLITSFERLSGPAPLSLFGTMDTRCPEGSKCISSFGTKDTGCPEGRSCAPPFGTPGVLLQKPR